MSDKTKPEKTKEELISEMTLDQLKLLLQIWNSPNRASFVTNPKNGPVVGALARKGFVRLAGKVGVAKRWQIVREKFTRTDISLVKELLNLEVSDAQEASGAFSIR